MDRRLVLQSILESIMIDVLEPGDPRSESNNVYFQPDENVRMYYPAIVYKRDRTQQRHANNQRYVDHTRYLIQVIDRSPDSKILKPVSLLPYTSHGAPHVVDGLNHDNFVTYFK